LFTRPRATRARLAALKPRVEWAGGGSVASPALPAGLVHLQWQLFRPLPGVQRSADADGICCIAAPGLLGEARLVARQVKTWLRDGVAAEEILVTLRDVLPYADLLREVFG